MADIQGGLIFIKKYSLEATCTTEKDLVKLNLLLLLLLSIVFNVLITILYSYLPTHGTAPHDRRSTFSINSYFCFLLLKFSVDSFSSNKTCRIYFVTTDASCSETNAPFTTKHV